MVSNTETEKETEKETETVREVERGRPRGGGRVGFWKEKQREGACDRGRIIRGGRKTWRG
jgi:hypothetical protein